MTPKEAAEQIVGRYYPPEVSRMLSVAITDAQTAQMWAVKAVTWQY